MLILRKFICVLTAFKRHVKPSLVDNRNGDDICNFNSCLPDVVACFCACCQYLFVKNNNKMEQKTDSNMNKIFICMPLKFYLSRAMFVFLDSQQLTSTLHFISVVLILPIWKAIYLWDRPACRTHQSADAGNRLLGREKYALISRKDALALNG